VGANGSGKTTLVETLTGNRELAQGKLSRGHNVTLGYLSQHTEVGGHGELTLLSYAQHETGLSEAKTRALLGRFLFSGDEVKKRLAEISGGEAQRLALALLTNSDANLLILDEPTNHLDVESREALEDALTGFGGTMLLISHDRALLEAVGSRTIVIDDQTLTSHAGGWAEYRSGIEAARAAASATAPRAARMPRAAGPSKNSKARLVRLEREVEEAEAAFKRLEDELADPSHWTDPERSAKATARHDRARAKLAELISRWEEAAERVEG
jgi:ATP-binding cassette subfamily F protein 3